MYAKLQYTGAHLIADVFYDAIQVLTGETNVNNLTGAAGSPDSVLDTGESFIDVSNSVAGWTLWDDDAGGAGSPSPFDDVVLRAPHATAPTIYKYARLTISSNRIQIRGYETWDNSAHSGTNQTQHSSNYLLDNNNDVSDTTAYHLSASARHMMGIAYYGGLAFTEPVDPLYEFTRDDAWNTPANGYPAWVTFLGAASITLYSNIYTPRAINTATGSDITGSSAGLNIHTPVGGFTGNLTSTLGNSNTNSLMRDENLNLANPFWPFGVSAPGQTNRLVGGDISSLAKVYLTTYNEGNIFDTFFAGSGSPQDTYTIWFTGNYRLAVLVG